MRRLLRALPALLILGAGIGESASAQRRVGLELVLALDASASVDNSEFRLQMQGLAQAFRQPEIIELVLAQPGGVAVAVVQWSEWSELGADGNWRLLDSRDSVLDFAAEIEIAPRSALGHRTAIGRALTVALDMLDSNAFDGAALKIDLSGDGKSNAGSAPDAARLRAIVSDVSISGLAILTDEADLDAYYRENVIAGPNGFVMVADEYSDFARAIRRKLLRELETRQRLSAVEAPARGRAGR